MSKKIVSTFSVLVFFVFVLLSCPQAPENNEKQTNPEDTRIIGIWKYAADTPPGTVYASSTAGYTAASGQTKAYKFNADKSMSDGNYTSPNFTDSTATISNAAWSVSGNILTLNYKLTSDGINYTDTWLFTFEPDNLKGYALLKSTTLSTKSGWVDVQKMYCVKQ